MRVMLVPIFATALCFSFINAENVTEVTEAESELQNGTQRSLYDGVAWLQGEFDHHLTDTVNDMRGKVRFYLFNNRKSPRQNEETTVISKKLFWTFNPNLPTKIITHGWHNSHDSKMEWLIKDAYLKNFDVNVICVDWSTWSTLSYNHARLATVNVAVILAEFIDRLNREHWSQNSRLHLIGHSLGAHTSGMAARQTKTGKISRVTGLDPAQPLYDMKILNHRLGPDVADFVEVIHTGGKRLGTQLPIGHVDLFPNSGDAVQRGCGEDFAGTCSHGRSYELYSEALLNPYAFVGYACSDWDTFRNGKCLRNEQYRIGENVNRRARGKYYFRTAAQSPYGLGDRWQTFTPAEIGEDKRAQAWASKLFNWIV